MRILADRFQQLPGMRGYTSEDSYTCEDNVTKHGAPLSGELLILQETRSQIIEVSSLSNAPLDDNLFEKPGNYKRVDYFTGQAPETWPDIVSRKLDQLGEAIATWFF
jgi:hypothetical protein